VRAGGRQEKRAQTQKRWTYNTNKAESDQTDRRKKSARQRREEREVTRGTSGMRMWSRPQRRRQDGTSLNQVSAPWQGPPATAQPGRPADGSKAEPGLRQPARSARWRGRARRFASLAIVHHLLWLARVFSSNMLPAHALMQRTRSCSSMTSKSSDTGHQRRPEQRDTPSRDA
jgi:hypothetical protein